MQRYSIFGSIGLLVGSVVAGCGRPAIDKADQAENAAPAAEQATDDEHHGHGAGPNGGTIADWGNGVYHVEFTVDHDKQEATVFVLADDGKTPAPVATDKLLLSIDDPRFQVDLMARPLDGEPDDASSRFVGQHEDLGNVREFAGTVSAEVEGTPYAGDFQEVAGDHVHE